MISDVFTIALRWFYYLKRDKFSIFISLVQPILWFILFGSIFQRVVTIRGFPEVNYLNFILAGSLVILTLNSLTAGIAILFDKERGYFERQLALPISKSSILIGRFIYQISIIAIQATLMILIGLTFNVYIKSGIIGYFLIIIIVMMLSSALTIISLSLAFVFKTHGSFFSAIGLINLPLIFLSTAFLPISAMPAWIASLVYLNPLSYAIDAIRSLILFGINFHILLPVLIILLAFNLITIIIASKIYAKGLG